MLFCYLIIELEIRGRGNKKWKGLLLKMGFEMCEVPAESDVVIFNTCAVREHAELKVYGNILG